MAGHEAVGGRDLRADQLQWLRWMKDNVATDLGLSTESFEYTPYVEHGGIGRAAQSAFPASVRAVLPS